MSRASLHQDISLPSPDYWTPTISQNIPECRATHLQVPDACCCKLNVSSASKEALEGCYILMNDILLLRKQPYTGKFRLYWCVVMFSGHPTNDNTGYLAQLYAGIGGAPSSALSHGMGTAYISPWKSHAFAFFCANTQLCEYQLASCAVSGC